MHVSIDRKHGSHATEKSAKTYVYDRNPGSCNADSRDSVIEQQDRDVDVNKYYYHRISSMSVFAF